MKLGMQFLLFVYLFVCALLKSLLCILIFVDFFNNKTNFDTPFFWQECSKNLVFHCSPSQKFLTKRNLTKQSFFFWKDFSRFFCSLPFQKSIFANNYLSHIIFVYFWSFFVVFFHRIFLSSFFHFLFCLILFVFLISSFLNSFFSTSLWFFWTTSSFLLNQKLSKLSMRYLCMSFFAHTFVHLLSLFFVVFSRFDHMCFPVPSVFSVHDLLWKTSLWNFHKFKKNLFVYFFFCWAPFHINVLHVCPSFFRSIFPFWFILICFWTCFFFVLVLECFSSVASIFHVSLFLRTLFGLIIVFLSFCLFFCYILSFFQKKTMLFLIWFRLYWFFFW